MEAPVPQLSLHTPVGDLTISEEDGAIVAVDWGRGRDQDGPGDQGGAVKQVRHG